MTKQQLINQLNREVLKEAELKLYQAISEAYVTFAVAISELVGIYDKEEKKPDSNKV